MLKEIKFKPTVICEQIDKESTFRSSEVCILEPMVLVFKAFNYKKIHLVFVHELNLNLNLNIISYS